MPLAKADQRSSFSGAEGERAAKSLILDGIFGSFVAGQKNNKNSSSPARVHLYGEQGMEKEETDIENEIILITN